MTCGFSVIRIFSSPLSVEKQRQASSFVSVEGGFGAEVNVRPSTPKTHIRGRC
jgi:hypothetical protein